MAVSMTVRMELGIEARRSDLSSEEEEEEEEVLVA
jgi:hypothetical protein